MSTAYSSKVKIVVSHWASKHARAAWMASYSFIAPAVPGAAVDSGSGVARRTSSRPSGFSVDTVPWTPCAATVMIFEVAVRWARSAKRDSGTMTSAAVATATMKSSRSGLRFLCVGLRTGASCSRTARSTRCMSLASKCTELRLSSRALRIRGSFFIEISSFPAPAEAFSVPAPAAGWRWARRYSESARRCAGSGPDNSGGERCP